MREILFRGKNNENKWVYGSYIHKTLHYGDPCDKHIILYSGEFDCDYYDMAEVHPDTLGQYTGLTDKNGQKIFEGDILARYNAFEYCNGSFCINGDAPLALWASSCAVLGNIHDNPELMEMEDD